MNTNQIPVVIFSANPGPLLDYCHRMVELGFFKELRGSYKGESEPSFMMGAAEFYGQGMNEVLLGDRQESILYLDNQRNAFLRWGCDYYRESAQQYLGSFRAVPPSVALSREAWTFDPETVQYYVAG